MSPVAHTLTSADRRLEILKSAAVAFRQRGYHGASVDEIAGTLAMTKGSLYYYFRNKEAILYACHEHSLDVLLALLQDVQADPSAPDVKLRTLVQALVQLTFDALRGTALTGAPHTLSPPLRRTMIARRDLFDRGLRAIIQDGMDRGQLARGDAKMTAFAMIGAVNGISTWCDPAGPMSPEQIGCVYADVLVGGLGKK